MGTQRAMTWMFLAALLILLGMTSSVGARSPAVEPVPPTLGPASAQAAVGLLLQYQARLTVPSTGQSVVNGTYSLVFGLYPAASGGSPLWTETKNVVVTDGLLSTALGDTMALPTGLFNGQALWLGIKVGADTEATPRQQILPVAYALGLAPGAEIAAASSSPALHVSNSGGYAGSFTGGGVYGQASNGYGGYFTSPTEDGLRGMSSGASGTYGGHFEGGGGVYGEGSSPSGYGGYFKNTASGRAIYAAGDVAQNLESDGLVKAAIFASVGGTAPRNYRDFNTVNGSVSLYICGTPPYTGHSCLDFNFDLSNRFWVGMSYDAGYVSCTQSAADTLNCFRYNAAGSLESGAIMVLVY